MKLPIQRIFIVGLATLITGCGDEILDYRNSQSSNGKIYNGNANQPFSGLVTNIPGNKIRLPVDIRIVFGEINKSAELYRASSFAFINDTSLICNSDFQDGVLHGDTTCFEPNTEFKRYSISFSKGSPEGTFVVFAKDGSTILAETKVKDGYPEGELKHYGPNNGRLIQRAYLRDGKYTDLHERWNEATGQLIYRADRRDGSLTLSETWSAEGKKLSETPFYNGKFHGVVRTWYENGTTESEVTYSNGIMEGPSKRWNIEGVLVSSGTYKGGVFYDDPTPTSAANFSEARTAENCIDQWIDAFRAEVGEDSSIHFDQINEWEVWCEEGRVP